MTTESEIYDVSEENLDLRPVHERYYTEKYKCIRKDGLNLDVMIRIHTNKLVLLYLSHKHEVFVNKEEIMKINFIVNGKDRANCQVVGKSKKGGFIMNPDTVLCFVETKCGKVYPVKTGINGKILEVNDCILNNPSLVADRANGFICIILTKLDISLDDFISKEEYENLG